MTDDDKNPARGLIDDDGNPILSDRYPLYCVDNGAKHDEHRYGGPFQDLADALAHAIDVRLSQEQPGDVRVRRCRRVLVSECYKPDLEYLLDDLLDRMCDWGGPGLAWANWEEPLIEQEDLHKDAEKRLHAWADENLPVKAYVCEGDEDDELRDRAPD